MRRTNPNQSPWALVKSMMTSRGWPPPALRWSTSWGEATLFLPIYSDYKENNLTSDIFVCLVRWLLLSLSYERLVPPAYYYSLKHCSLRRRSMVGRTAAEHHTVLPGHMNLPKIPIPSWEAAQNTGPRSHASTEHISNTLLSRAKPGRGFEGLSLPREGYFCDLSHHFLWQSNLNLKCHALRLLP